MSPYDWFHSRCFCSQEGDGLHREAGGAERGSDLGASPPSEAAPVGARSVGTGKADPAPCAGSDRPVEACWATWKAPGIANRRTVATTTAERPARMRAGDMESRTPGRPLT